MTAAAAAVHVHLPAAAVVVPLALATCGVVLHNAVGEVLAAERALDQALVLLGAPLNAALTPARSSRMRLLSRIKLR